MYEKIKNITSHIRSSLGISENTPGRENLPEIGIILGSGLGSLAEAVDVIATVNYNDIEGFPRATVAGHQGRFIYGRLAGKRILMMQGRVHFYEGYSMDQVVTPVKVMIGLGIRVLVVSNAAGGVNADFAAGDLMLIRDHISLLPNPLIGPNDDSVGQRFPPMHGAYDPTLAEALLQSAARVGVTLRQGVYLGWSGPSYETPAEYKMYRAWGADCVGMSTTPEVIVAKHAGVPVLGISLVANVIGKDALKSTSHEEVQEVGVAAGARMCTMLVDFLQHLSI